MSADSATSPTSWADLLARLLDNQDLTSGQSHWAMSEIMRGEATGAQIAAFGVALRAKGETADEVAGLVEAMLEHATTVEIDGPTLDIVGTGGDLAHTVNISTMASVVCAAAGARVIKHGNRAASSQCGSADVLEALGLKLEQTPEDVQRSVETVGIGFCFAPMFHPAYRHAGPPRREIGVPTVFNVLGPLANPGRPSAQLVGCANRTLAPVMADVLSARGVSSMVVRGMDGLDEVTIFDATEVWDATAAAPVSHTALDLEGTGIPRATAGALAGGDAQTNADVVRRVLAGETDGRLAAVADAVALNAAAAMVTWDAIDGQRDDRGVTVHVAAQLPRVREVIASGQAGMLLDRWIDLSNE